METKTITLRHHHAITYILENMDREVQRFWKKISMKTLNDAAAQAALNMTHKVLKRMEEMEEDISAAYELDGDLWDSSPIVMEAIEVAQLDGLIDIQRYLGYAAEMSRDLAEHSTLLYLRDVCRDAKELLANEMTNAGR